MDSTTAAKQPEADDNGALAVSAQTGFLHNENTHQDVPVPGGSKKDEYEALVQVPDDVNKNKKGEYEALVDFDDVERQKGVVYDVSDLLRVCPTSNQSGMYDPGGEGGRL